MTDNTAKRFDLRALGRALASIGVILSLLFVGLELRQSRQLARAQVRQGLADRNAVGMQAIAQNPELARAWAELWQPGGRQGLELTRADTTQATYQLQTLLRAVENVYLQFLEGVVDESVLDSYGFRNSPIFVLPEFKPFWAGVRQRYDPRFVAAFEAEYAL